MLFDQLFASIDNKKPDIKKLQLVGAAAGMGGGDKTTLAKTYGRYLLKIMTYGLVAFLNIQIITSTTVAKSPDSKTDYEIISLSMDKILAQNPHNLKLIYILTLMAAKDIPYALIYPYLKKEKIDITVFSELIKQLKKQSLTTTSDKAEHVSLDPTIHSLMHKHTSELLNDKNNNAQRILANNFIDATKTHIEEVLAQRNLRAEKELMIHLEAIIKNAVNLGANEIFLLYVIGTIKGRLGDYKQALSILDKANKKSRQYKDLPIILKVKILTGLAGEYWELREFETALRYNNTANKLFKKHKIINNNLQGSLLTLTMIINTLSGKYEEAEKYGNQLLKLQKSNPKNILHNILANLNVAYNYTLMEKYHKAIIYSDQALVFVKKLNGTQKTMLYSDVIRNKGYALMHIGDLINAKILLNRSLQLCKKGYGNNHIRTVYILSNLGSLYIKLADFEKAEKYLNDSFVMARKHAKDDTIFLNKFDVYFGDLYLAQKQFARAKLYYEKALKKYDEYPDGFAPEKSHIKQSLAIISKSDEGYKQGSIR